MRTLLLGLRVYGFENIELITEEYPAGRIEIAEPAFSQMRVCEGSQNHRQASKHEKAAAK